MENTVITVSHQKGGVGKSTVALNIAVELSKEYPALEILLVKDKNNSLKLFSKFRNTKNTIVKNKK